jgi:hypothetical protein
MSLQPITLDIERSIVTEDDGGGEAVSPNIIYAGLNGTVSFPDLDAVTREETGAGPSSGPGTFTRSDRVVFIDPWDGTIQIEVSDVVKPNPTVNWLPAGMKVIAVREYPDDDGQVQLDVEDVN